MGKNKNPQKKITNPAGESQKLGGKRKMPMGAYRPGGQNPK